MALIRESLSVAHKTGAVAPRDLERVVVDTTVKPKAIAHPTDARLCHRALQKIVNLARHHGVPLRQSYRRLAKRAAIMVGRYTMPTSSSGRGASSNSCVPDWAGYSATSAARSPAIRL